MAETTIRTDRPTGISFRDGEHVATFRGALLSAGYGRDEAQVSFLWGRDKDDLDRQTEAITVNEKSGFDAEVEKLIFGGKYYYRAIVDEPGGHSGNTVGFRAGKSSGEINFSYEGMNKTIKVSESGRIEAY